MHAKLRILLMFAIAFTLLFTGAEAAKPPSVTGKPGGGGGGPTLPNDMASLGDSITQAMNADGSNWFDNPEHSWSTGDHGSDGISSHYERIKDQNRKIRSNNWNFAVSGSKMADLAGQAQQAANAGADYVTILMGANDLCTSSPSTMTSTATFRAQFQAAADILQAGIPSATVYVISVPDVYNLWAIYDGHWGAEWTWNAFNICQSLLSNSRSEADRQLVRTRNIEFNTALAEEAAAYGFVWDNNAGFNTAFVRSDVSSVDYFHPSMNGQAKIAAVTWAAGPFA